MLTAGKEMQKKLLVATRTFSIAMSDFGAKKLTRCSRVLVVTELVLTKCYVSQASKGPNGQ